MPKCWECKHAVWDYRDRHSVWVDFYVSDCELERDEYHDIDKECEKFEKEGDRS